MRIAPGGPGNSCSFRSSLTFQDVRRAVLPFTSSISVQAGARSSNTVLDKPVHRRAGTDADWTIKGVTSWKEGESDSFFTDIKNIRISLTVKEGGSFDAEDYIISFYSLTKGELIFEFADVDLKETMNQPYLLMRDLYQQARLIARGYKGQLDELLNDLIKDDPEDIPF